MKRWVSKRYNADYKSIAMRYNISEIFAEVLVKRGLFTTDAMDKYLFPDIKEMYAPEKMKDLVKACDILKVSISEKKKIMVIGDYDVDGIMSSYILIHGLEMLGADVSYRIPHRVKDGYGIRDYMVDEAYALGIQTIITCDNGISAIDAAKRAKELGVTYILTDHHEVPAQNEIEIIPPADAVVNPKQSVCNYPFSQLCGAGVVYKILSCLFEECGDKRYINELLPFAAVATVCDVVPLEDENRIIVSNGIKILSDRSLMKNIGMLALLNELQINEQVSSGDLGFKIGPCINAAGRLSDAVEGLELLLEKDNDLAVKHAERLVELNEIRKDMTAEAEREAVSLVDKTDLNERPVIVLFLKDCHESVAGIVAGRIKERYYRPVYILTKGENGLKGSGRSIHGYHMQSELMKCKELLIEFGGHAMAAGFSLLEENLELFADTLNQNCRLTDKELLEKVVFDKEVALYDMNCEIVRQFDYMQPFGESNPKAVFAKREVMVKSVYMCGRDNQIARLKLEDGGKTFDAVDFSAEGCIGVAITERYGAQEWEKMKSGICGQSIDILYSPEINERYGNLQFKIIDCR